MAWLRDQPRTSDLLETAVLGWVRSFSGQKLRGIRFMTANPLLLRGLADSGGDRIGTALNALVDALTDLVPEHDDEDVMVLRMALLSINAAVAAAAAAGRGASDATIIAAAERAASALLGAIGARS